VRWIGLAWVCICVTPLALSGSLVAQSASEAGQLTAATLYKRGGQLAADIEATYKQLRASRTLRIAIKGGNDITGIVAKYIPPGTDRSDAESILRTAGYPIAYSEQGHIVSRSIVRGGLLGLYGYELAIDLTPRAPSDPTVIGVVDATIAARYVPNVDRR
jgi:hypothetical protein